MKKENVEKTSAASICLVLASILFFSSAVGLFAINKHKNRTDETPSQTEQAKTSIPQIIPPVPQTVAEKTTVGPNADPFMNPTVITIDPQNPYLTLVNTNYRIPSSYEPHLSYVCGTQERLDETA